MLSSKELSKKTIRAEATKTAEKTEGDVSQLKKLEQADPNLVLQKSDLHTRVNDLILGFRGGITGLGTDEKRVLGALKGLDSSKITELSLLYEERTRSVDKNGNIKAGRSLMTDLSKELSGKTLLEGLRRINGDHLTADVLELKREFKRINPNKETILSILSNYQSGDVASANNLSDKYKQLFGASIEQEINNRTFSKSDKKTFMAFLSGTASPEEVSAVKKHANSGVVKIPEVNKYYEFSKSTSSLESNIASALDIEKKEKTNGLGAIAVRHAGIPAGKQVKNAEKVLTKEFEMAKKDGIISDYEDAHLRQAAIGLGFDVQGSVEVKKELSHIVSGGAAITAGALTGIAGGAPAGAAAKALINKIISGSDYNGREEFKNDLKVGAVLGLLGAALGEINFSSGSKGATPSSSTSASSTFDPTTPSNLARSAAKSIVTSSDVPTPSDPAGAIIPTPGLSDLVNLALVGKK